MNKKQILRTVILLSIFNLVNINCAYADILPSPIDVTLKSFTGATILSFLTMGIALILLKVLKFTLKKRKTCD